MARARNEQQRLAGLRVGLVQVVPDQDAFDGGQARCAAQAISKLEGFGAEVEWLSNIQQVPALESLDSLVLFLHRPAGDLATDRTRAERCESVIYSATRLIDTFRQVRPDRLSQYRRKEVTEAQANTVQLCGPRAILLDPVTQERCRGTGLIYHYTDSGVVPDLDCIYRDGLAPVGLSAFGYQIQEVIDDAELTLQRWHLGNREKAELVFMIIKHSVNEMHENTRRAQIRRPVPGDERNSLELVIDGYECPPDMPNRKNVVETIARGVRQTREAVARGLNLREFPTPAGGSGSDTQKFQRLFWALHTFFGTRDEHPS